MKILMLSWRDMKHPLKGGAEIVTDIYLSHLAKSGHDVTLFSSEYKGCKKEESYNNYKIIRKGNQLTCHYHGLVYATKNQNQFNKIIDQVNTIPFFTPLTIKKEKRIAFFHQLCKNIWFYEKSLPIAIIGYTLESIYLKLYKTTKTLTVSESSKQDLIKSCWINQKNNPIKVLENQIDFQPITNQQLSENQTNKTKQKDNYVIFCGRLTKSKRVHDCIKALSLASKNSNNQNNISNFNNNTMSKSSKSKNLENSNITSQGININNKEFDISQTKLVIIGNGNQKYKDYLIKLTNKLNLNERVIFKGSLNSIERNKLMQKALAILVTSVKEGWGLIVTEANGNGTIAITYDIDGLRDANKDSTGFITQENTPKALAESINTMINNPKLRMQKEKSALEFARQHSDWNKNCKEMERWIRQ